MNVRKPIDYSAMFAALDAPMAAEYLCGAYPDVSVFSPRNLRRMREFYRTYESAPEVLAEAMTIGWTQNVVILEAELTLQERVWYVRAAQQSGWSKLELTRKTNANAHLEISLDFTDDACYTEAKNSATECTANDEYPLYLLWQHLPQPNGLICDEGSGQESWTGNPVSHRIRRHQHRGNQQSGLPACPPQAGRTWHRLHRQNGPPADQCRLRQIRSSDRAGAVQPAGYVPHLRRRFQRQDAPVDGIYRIVQQAVTDGTQANIASAKL